MPFGSVLQIVLSIILNLVVVLYLLRGPYRRFPLVLLSCSFQLLDLLVTTLAALIVGSRSHHYQELYWSGDMLYHLCLFALVISLIREGIDEKDKRLAYTALCCVAALCFAAFSLVHFQSSILSRWLTPVSRNLSFGEEILNFVLWGVLLQKPKQDTLLLLVSTGIGIQVTGEVIGHTLRMNASPLNLWVPTLLIYVCELLCLGLWIYAFSSREARMSGAGKAARA